MTKKLLLLSFFAFLIHYNVLGQTNDCGGIGAILTVGTTCITTEYFVTSSFDNSMGNPTCTSDSVIDGWFQFTTDATTTEVTITCDGNRELTIALYTACNLGNEVDCIASNNGDATLPNVAVTPNTTYYIRLIRTTNNGNSMEGEICVTKPAETTTPSNDLCANATSLNCGTTNLSGSTNGTTNQASGTGCSLSNYGVWYSFVGNGDQTTITTDAADGFDQEMNIASGSCGTLTNIDCVDDAGGGGIEDYTFISNVGTTYYVYVAHYYSTSITTGDFTISRTCTPVTTPPNDAICNATPVTVNPDLLCGSVVSGTVEFASNSGIDFCGGTEDDDVWYRFVATATSHTISLINRAGSTTDLYHAVYNGSCTAPVLIAGTCSDFENSTVTGLTPGMTYWVQVYSWTSTPGQTSTFDICIGTYPPCTIPIVSPGPITFGTITDVSISGTFPDATPTPDNYIVIRSSSATPPILTNGTIYTIGQTFGGYTVVDNDINPDFTATGLTQTTSYHFFVFSINNEECANGPIYSATSLYGTETTEEPTYCIPSSTDPDYYINNFNTSGAVINITHNSSGFSPAGYGDFTSLNVAQYPGQVINFTIDFVDETYASRIWVDWNNDLDFADANELVYDNGTYVYNPTNGSFTVWAMATPGNYRMRLRSAWLNTSVSECGFENLSETHDYTLTVTPLDCTANPQVLTAVPTSSTTATISWTAPAPAPVNGYEYIISTDNSTNSPGDDITNITAATSVNLTGLALGTTYYVFVRGRCTSPDNGVWIPTTFTTGCGDIITTPTVCPIIIDEQGNNPFTANPFIADPTVTLGCATTSVKLVANSNLRETTSYIVEQITYPTPAPEFDFPLFSSPDAQVIHSDDVWAESRTDIGFNFCFYNQTYTQTLVGANGAITFNPAIAPGDASGYDFYNNLPSTADALFEYTIYGVYHDINPYGLDGTPIKSRTIGTPGCRQFQVAWNNIPMFGDDSRLYTGMIVLHETTNIIEVFIKEKRIENGNVNPWIDGNALVGIQGDITAPNNQYLAAPCRNSLDTNWETTNEAWRFTPNGAIILPASVTWYQGSIALGNIISSNPDDSVTVLTGNTYFAEVAYNNLCGVDITLTDEIVVTDGRKTWNGSVNNDWAMDANWTPSGVPTPIDCITIPDMAIDPIINSTTDGDGFSLLILPGATLTAQPNASLTIVDLVNVNTDATFLLEDSASLIQLGNPSSNNNTGNIRMQRTAMGVGSQNYVYWSSPVEGFDVANINTAASELRWEWDPTIDGILNGTWTAASGAMTVGKGYIVRGLATPPTPIPAENAEFVGRPSNGIITVPIARGTYNGMPYTAGGGGNTEATAIDDNWNLVGNPYPSAVSADIFINMNAAALEDNPPIVGTIYLWQRQGMPSASTDPFYDDYVYNYMGTNYVAYNPTGSNPPLFDGNIAAGQSFFIQMDDDAGTNANITFDNTMRSRMLANDNFLRTMERHRVWLDLIDQADAAISTLVGYVQNATNSKDRLYDGHNLSETSMKFYSMIGDEKMTIQGRELPFDSNDFVPLGIEVPQNGTYKIAINTTDGLFADPSQSIFLEDTYLNLVYDLRSAPYLFTTIAGKFDDRFILRYTNETLGLNDYDSAVFDILAFDDRIKVTSSNSLINTVIVYDILGRVLADYKKINQLDFYFNSPNQSNGTLIIKATLYNGKQKIKKVIY